MGVTKAYSTLNPPTIVGSTGTFTITARNNGPRTAFQVQYRDVLPPTLAFAGPAPTATAGTFTTSGNTGTWTISAILPLTTQTLSFTVSVLSAATPTSTAYINSANVQRSLSTPSGNLPLPDPVPGNNQATATVALTASVNLGITKTNGVTALVAGGTTAYTITVSNIGPYTATAASLRDPAATGLSCTAVSCAAAVNATCPAAASVTIAALQSPSGIAVTLPPASTLQFIVTCGVTATGAWLAPNLLEPAAQVFPSASFAPLQTALNALQSLPIQAVFTSERFEGTISPNMILPELLPQRVLRALAFCQLYSCRIKSYGLCQG